MKPDHSSDCTIIPPEARRWMICGQVQGVGYRAFVFNLALRLGLTGRVQNLTGEVLVEAQGEPAALAAFGAALVAEAPPLARPLVLSSDRLPLRDFRAFEILPSVESALPNVHVPPDSFLCDDCLRELFDAKDRRYRYPFSNCTQCGPRYTLIVRMPYDRPSTTMAEFLLCPSCRAEYEDPNDRRFHAQPLACPACGPQLSFATRHGREDGDEALQACIRALQNGDIVAVKGVGGYHLLCDAFNVDAIAQLRARKRRPHKPLAVMFPWGGSDGLQCVRNELQLDEAAASALVDASRPILLIPRRKDSSLSPSLAPGLNEIGAMLPYSPLHHLLLAGLDNPVVATSGNVSGEPVLTVNQEAEDRLGHVAHAFLHHDRPIARPADDSVLHVIGGLPRVLRAGRGIAPVEFALPFELPQPMLATGGHLKNAIALAWAGRAVLSPHIGDLDAPRSLEVFEQVIADLQRLYRVRAQVIACDMHPGYGSSRWAAKQALPILRIQHHHAHASALAFEKGLDEDWLVFTWDGAGLGPDGALWGGEVLHGRPGAWLRVATLKSFRLPGGERASREPWRSAAAVCWEIGLDWRPAQRDSELLKRAWQHRLNSPVTTSAGRLFDAAASLLGLCDIASFEGQAPMLMEAAATREQCLGEIDAVKLPLHEDTDGMLTADWTPLVECLLDNQTSVGQRAMKFHVSLAQCIADVARRVRARVPFDAVGLTGGAFQNRLLAELALARLRTCGFQAQLPQRVPCNDGGLALGQLIEAGFQNA